MSREPADKRDLMPASALPLAYYGLGYAGFGAAMLALVIDPSIPGASFYQPRVVALVHLVTLAWLTGSILGSLYIVAPLALTMPMQVRKADWIAFGAFALGVSGMVSHFWINTYDGMAWSAVLAMSAVTRAGMRVVGGLRDSKLPYGVRLHITLAFLNIHAAAVLGMVIGFDRSRGFLSISPLAATFAHAHVAAAGFVMMLVIGLSYRLIPMMLPAAMPSGGSLAASAILLQAGIVAVAVSLMMNSSAVVIGAALIAAGVVSFVMHVRAMLRRRLPRPPALPSRDWSTWQVHMAFACLVITVATGLALTVKAPGDHSLPLMWIYGVAGLVGFLAQMVAGMQGRLVPLYAWYRAYAAIGAPPSRPANALPSPAFARVIFLCWAAAVPLLMLGLPFANQLAIRGGAIFLLTGVGAGAAYVVHLLREARAV